MSDKDKVVANQPKNIPKDGQVIMAIMKEMGITEYESTTIVQLTEFVYRYATCILEEARTFPNNPKELLDVDHVRLAIQLTTEASFISPPPREIIIECANVRNYATLAGVKPHCGLRLPPDRYCLSSCNYILRSSANTGPTGIKKLTKQNFGIAGNPTVKITNKPGSSYIKRPPNIGQQKQGLSVVVPKVNKIGTATPTLSSKAMLKPKIQISSLVSTNGGGAPMDIEGVSLKRKREDDILS